MLRASAVLPPDTNRLAELRCCLRNRLPIPVVGQYTCIDCLRLVWDKDREEGRERGRGEGGGEGGGGGKIENEGGAKENEGKQGDRGQTPHPLTPWLT